MTDHDMRGEGSERPVTPGIIDPHADWSAEEGMLGVLKRMHPTEAHQYSCLGDNGETYLRDCAWRAYEDARKESPEGPLTALEIGTHRGVSSTILAQIFDHVVTIDKPGEPEHHFAAGHGIRLEDAEWQEKTWRYFGVRKKVTACVPDAGDEGKISYIESMGTGYCFAFIDGDHRYDGIKLDWDLVKRCGRVAFHDWRPHVQCHLEATCKVVKEIEGWDRWYYPNFAYCQKRAEHGDDNGP